MSAKISKTNIYIMGFMGCGKSHVGQRLSKIIKRPFLDTDQMIEAETRMTIPQIFKENGEVGFRILEKNIIQRVSQLQKHVISLGGGAVLDPENWKILSESGTTITLSYPPEIIMSRLANRKDRPLLNDTRDQDRLDRIKVMLEHRRPFYYRADLVLHFNQVIRVDAIVKMLQPICEVPE